MKKRAANKPGFDGAKPFKIRTKISSVRSETRTMRAIPGSFEWKYGRASANLALYHAGSHYAVLWERAGTADAKSPNFESTGGGGGWKGMPDGRCAALDDISLAVRELGKLVTVRLTDYCVRGMTVAQIAKKHSMPPKHVISEREMGHILGMDLRACALHFNFI